MLNHYKNVEFGSDVSIGIIRRKSLYSQILHEEISAQVVDYCNQLGIRFAGISGQYYENGDAPGEYVIRAIFEWW